MGGRRRQLSTAHCCPVVFPSYLLDQPHALPYRSPSTLQQVSPTQTFMACRSFSTAFAAELQRGSARAAAATPVSAAALAQAFHAIDNEAVLEKENASRVLR